MQGPIRRVECRKGLKRPSHPTPLLAVASSAVLLRLVLLGEDQALAMWRAAMKYKRRTRLKIYSMRQIFSLHWRKQNCSLKSWKARWPAVRCIWSAAQICRNCMQKQLVCQISSKHPRVNWASLVTLGLVGCWTEPLMDRSTVMS